MSADDEPDSPADEEEFNRDDGGNELSTTVVESLRIAPVADINADAWLLLLLIDAVAATKFENRMLADAAVANDKTNGDENRILKNRKMIQQRLLHYEYEYEYEIGRAHV